MPLKLNPNLPPGRAEAEVMKDALVDLRETEVFQLVLGRLEALLQQDLRRLEAEADPLSIRYLQGSAKGHRDGLEMIGTLLKEIENTNYPEEASAHVG